jgi:hypothetical protein
MVIQARTILIQARRMSSQAPRILIQALRMFIQARKEISANCLEDMDANHKALHGHFVIGNSIIKH